MATIYNKYKGKDFDYAFWIEADKKFKGIRIELSPGEMELRISRVIGMRGTDQIDLRLWTHRVGAPAYVARQGGFRFEYHDFVTKIVPALNQALGLEQ